METNKFFQMLAQINQMDLEWSSKSRQFFLCDFLLSLPVFHKFSGAFITQVTMLPKAVVKHLYVFNYVCFCFSPIFVIH